MRLAPVPLVYATDFHMAVELSGESSRTTHGAREAVDSCRYLGGLIAAATAGIDKSELLSRRYSQPPGSWLEHPLCDKVEAIADGSFKTRTPPDIKGTGYVIDCLEAALWAFHTSDSFEEGCLRAVNLGDDADTTAAVYGQLAGAYYGEEGIPEAWKNKIAHRSLIVGYAEQLFKLADRIKV